MPNQGRGFLVFTPLERKKIHCHACSSKTITRYIFDNALKLSLSVVISCAFCNEPAYNPKGGDITDDYWWQYVLSADAKKEKKFFPQRAKFKPAFNF